MTTKASPPTDDPSKRAAAAPCTRCGENLYLCAPKGHDAVARVCDCQTPCPLCDGLGHSMREDERGYLYAQPCRCLSLQRRVTAFNRSRIPAKFFDRDLVNYEPQSERQSSAQLAASKFVRNFTPGIPGFLLMGPVGTGKTHLVCAVLAQLTLERGVACRFVDFFHLLHDLKDGFSLNRPMGELLGPLEEVTVLAVDELGKGKSNEWELSVLDELISKRYNQQKTTLFTTNYTNDPDTTYSLAGEAPRLASAKTPQRSAVERKVLRETLEERLGPRIYSRLLEMCSFRYIDGPDWRTTRLAAPQGG